MSLSSHTMVPRLDTGIEPQTAKCTRWVRSWLQLPHPCSSAQLVMCVHRVCAWRVVCTWYVMWVHNVCCTHGAWCACMCMYDEVCWYSQQRKSCSTAYSLPSSQLRGSTISFSYPTLDILQVSSGKGEYTVPVPSMQWKPAYGRSL